MSVPPCQSVLATVVVEREGDHLLVESTGEEDAVIASTVVSVSFNQTARVLLVNYSEFTRELEQGQVVGEASEVEIVECKRRRRRRRKRRMVVKQLAILYQASV